MEPLGSRFIHLIPPTGREHLLADLAHAEQAQAAGVEASTHTKCYLAWRRWLEYLNSCDLELFGWWTLTTVVLLY